MKKNKRESRGPAESGFTAVNNIFARAEQVGGRIGLGMIIIGLVLYVTGIFPPLLPIEDLTANWGYGVDEFIRRTGQPTGWSWIGKLGHSDMLSLAGLVVLSGVVGVAYLAILPQLLKQKERVYLVLAILQLLVFVLAASGWLTGH